MLVVSFGVRVIRDISVGDEWKERHFNGGKLLVGCCIVG